MIVMSVVLFLFDFVLCVCDLCVVEVDQDRLVWWLCCQVGQVIGDFGMIEVGDWVMVCLFGGKDSYILLDLLLQLQKKVLVDFELVVVNLDQKQFGFFIDVLFGYLCLIGVLFQIIEQDIYLVVIWVILEGCMMCLLCLWLWCGVLYCYVVEYGFIKIVLGYYCDDSVVMFFLNLFYYVKLLVMLFKLCSDDGVYVVICLLVYVSEQDIVCYVQVCVFLIILCMLCGSQDIL